MAMIRIGTAKGPFASRAVAARAAATLRLADAMGLLPDEEKIERLDAATFHKLGEWMAAAGIGGSAVAQLQSGGDQHPDAVAALLERLECALEESPVPEREWTVLEKLFGTQRLADLLHVSSTSVRRYRSGSRPTPDELAARLHFLAKVVGDLSGAYNEIGVRRWFDRRRAALEDRSPAQLLSRSWTPEGAGALRVRELARSLVSSPAT